MVSTAEMTEKYILEHASVKDCLRKGLINYSALARLIASERGIENESSKEAILVAARRFREKMKGRTFEDEIVRMFNGSNVEIKNNIVIFTLEKYVYPDSLIDVEKQIKRDKALFFSIEGAKTITLIVQGTSAGLIEKNFTGHMIDKKGGLSLISIASKGIESCIGAVSYISGLFFENGVNIVEFMSCYDDTLIVVDSGDVSKVIGFLNF